MRWKSSKKNEHCYFCSATNHHIPFSGGAHQFHPLPISDDPTTERISQDIFIIWWERGWVSANIYLKSKISLCSIGGTGNFLLPLLAGIHSTIVILLCSARKSESANTHFSRKVLYSCLSLASVSHRRAARRSSRRTVHRKCFILPASYVNELCRWR